MNRLASLILLAASALAGCTPTLETEYKPRPLNSSDADRRSFYASPFTPESHPAKEGGPAVSPLGPG